MQLEHCELMQVPDDAWADYKRDGDKEVLSTRQARFFRSIFVPSLASAIGDEVKRSVFPDCMEEKLKRRLADRPTPFQSFAQTIVLSKQGFAPTPAVQS